MWESLLFLSLKAQRVDVLGSLVMHSGENQCAWYYETCWQNPTASIKHNRVILWVWNVTFIAYQIEGHTTFYRTNCLGIHLYYTKRDTSFTFLWHFGIFFGKESFHFDMPILLSKVVKLDNTFVSRKRMHFFVESRRQNFCIKWNLIDTLQTFFFLFFVWFCALKHINVCIGMLLPKLSKEKP